MIEVQHLEKQFGDFVAVRDLHLSIAEGELFAFLGPNGAGKTTTMRVLMGILKATRGSAKIAGFDCFADRVAVKRLVGFAPDEPIFHDYLRGREIVEFVGGMHGLSHSQIAKRTNPIFERMELVDALDDFAVNYSRGMKKKLGFACALVHEPRLLILDEPTSGLDPIATRAFHELLLERVAGGTTVLLSSHMLDQVEKVAHRTGILHQGRLAAVGTLDELRAQARAGGSLEEIFFAVADQGPADA